MKILLAHNFYRSSAPSGEDAVYRNERALLEKHFELVRFEKYNDDLDDSTLAKKLRLALDGAWSRQTYRELTDLIRREKPDVAHFHNTFPQITPAAWSACRDQGVPVVQTLHNFRYICPGALLQRDSEPCERCVEGSLINALRYRCYRDSLSASAAQTWTILRNRINGSFRNKVNRYLALTEFAAGRMVAGGLPGDRITVKPNFLPSPPQPGAGEGGYVVYTGRLSVEKGVRTLLEAWRRIEHPPRLLLMGDGPLRAELENYVTSHQVNAEFLGYCDADTVIATVRGASLQVIPSEWYEGFPMVVLEAYACGTPVLAASIGSLDEVVEENVTGFKFQAGNVHHLSDKIRQILSDSTGLKAMRQTVRETFDNHYTAEQNLAAITDVYRTVIAENRDKGRAFSGIAG